MKPTRLMLRVLFVSQGVKQDNRTRGVWNEQMQKIRKIEERERELKRWLYLFFFLFDEIQQRRQIRGSSTKGGVLNWQWWWPNRKRENESLLLLLSWRQKNTKQTVMMNDGFFFGGAVVILPYSTVQYCCRGFFFATSCRQFSRYFFVRGNVHFLYRAVERA